MANLLENVTIEQFKMYFARDFSSSFLPVWQEDKTYFTDDIVYYDNQFYKSLIDNNTSLPTDSTDWEITKGNIYKYITDDDIQKAMSQAIVTANPRFGATNEEKINIYLHLVAFYLLIDLKNANSGLNSSYAGLIASKSVDGVSVSYNFPTWMTNSPMFSLLSQNGYGMKYLSLILPYLSTTFFYSRGGSTIG